MNISLRYLILFVIIMLVVIPISSAFGEFALCSRDYSVTCWIKFYSYYAHDISGSCEIDRNETYVPEVRQPLNLLVDIYSDNTTLTKSYLETEFSKVNTNWAKYGVRFLVASVYVSNETYLQNLKSERDYVYKRLENYYNFSQSIKTKRVVIVLGDLQDHKEAGIQFMDKGTLVSTLSKNQTWLVTHELGHILGLLDNAFYSEELNLMTHDGCIKYKFYPTNLNKKQAGVVKNTSISIYNDQKNTE